jgi:VCBS repeat-containing protein
MADSVFLAAQEISVGEADGQVLVTFKRAGDFSTPVTITYGVTDDTATNGADYTAPAFGTATIPIGADHVSIAIPIINDALGEATESFVVSIVGVDADFLTHGIILAPRTARVTILDDENPVTPPVDPPLVSNFNVTLQPVSTGYELPIKLEFLPTNANQAVVGQKDGLIQVVDMTTGTHLGVFLDLRGEVNAVQDRGLIDMAFSPDLQHNPYFYATFAVDPAGTAGNGLNGVDGSGNRFVHLVRYTLDAATNYTTIVANSAVTLVGNAGQTFADISGAGLKDFTDPTNSALVSSEKYVAAGQTPSTVIDGFKQNYWKIDSLSHIGGAISFGPDGKLYVSTGDGTSFDYADPRTPDVLNINSLSGKVLRLDPVTGQGLTDNPFYTAGMSLDSNAAKVFQLGLRNPFAMGFSPDGQLFISNTGWNSWEMIENGPAGANFGWPYFEGGDGGVRIQTPVYKDFPTASAFYSQLANGQIVVTPAYRAFAHDSALPGYQVQAITAGDVIYSGDKYPVELTNDFFFADVVDGELYSVDVYNRQELQFLYKGTDVGITDFKQGPDGYVYYVDLSHGIVGRLLITPKATGGLPAMTASGSTTAVQGSAGEYTVTNALDQLGGLMSNARIDLSQNFVITFEMNFGANDFGADGMGFVLHNDPRGAATIGWGGANLGLMSIVNGLGIAFDTYQNADRGDIVNDSASFVDTDALTQTARIDLGNVEDGLAKHIVVSWNAATQTLSYTLNGATIGTVTNATFAQTYFGGSNFVYFGFAAATGGAFNTQSVKLTDLTATLEGGATGAAPVAVADTFATNEDVALPVSAARNVLTNDTDADTPNANLTAILDTTTAHGALTLNANGTFTYTPVANYNGADTFTYHTSDGAHVSAPTTVTINLAPVNDPPTVVGETLAATRNTPLIVTAASLLTNDADPDGDAITLSAVSAPVNGTVSLNAGQVTFTPTANFVGAASFVYTVSDGKGGSTNGTATVNVTAPASGAPVAVNDAYTVNEDQTLSASSSRNVLTNDTDPDTPRANLTAVLDTTTTHGTLTLAANGTFTYRATANYFGVDTFTYHVSDGVNASASATVTITVAPVNDAPVITYNGGSSNTLTVLENQQQILAQITVTDVDGTTPTYTLTGADAGDFTIGANGALRFAATPNFEAPADSDANNQYSVTVRVTDTAAVSDTINLTINVQDVAEGAVLLGTAGNDTNFRGTAGSDIMQAGAGNDTVLGQGGNDVFLATVGDGNDSYTGGAGVDTIDFSAITAAATINLNTGAASSAQTGTDTLNTIENAIGGAGADTLTGTSAANRLSGGAGADVLTGGGGSDLFVFGPGFGADRITDFGDVSGNQDMVSFAGFLFTDIAAVTTHAAQVGADTVIDFGGGDILTLVNFQLSAFGPEDYFI